MAFYDNPIVDISSKQSEASVHAVLDTLSTNNGFICREEKPDYGVDITAELIIDEQASGYRFPIQIKSSKNLNKIESNDNHFISYQFLTSRLGYLCRLAPGYGIVVLYDDSSHTVYFDFVEEICQRLSSSKPQSDWQQQKYVNIHIPTANILDDTSAAKIHEVYQKRFINHKLLVEQHGAKYGIPIISDRLGFVQLDTNNPRTIVNFLTEYGTALFNHQDFAFLIKLIQKISPKDIEASPELAFVAAITYSESGLLIDARYYMRLVRKFESRFSDEELALLDLYGSETDFRFGDIDIENCISRLSEVQNRLSNVNNKLSILVRIDRLRILTAFGLINRDKQNVLVTQIRQTEKAIREAEIEANRRNILLLAVAGNLHQLGLNILSSSVTAIRIKEKMLGPTSEEERLQEAKQVEDIIESSNIILENIYKELQQDNSDAYVRAYTLYQISFTFCSFAFNSFMLSEGKRSWTQDWQDLFSSRYNGALSAYNEFVEMGAMDNAYSALTTAFELKILHDYTFSSPMPGASEDELQERIKAIGQQLGRTDYVSLVKKFINDTLPKSQDIQRPGFLDIEVGKERNFASSLAAALQLPASYIDNIVADIIANRRFYTIIPDPNAELLQDLRHSLSRRTMYSDKVIYTGNCRKCGFRTKPSRSVDTIIEDYILQHGKICLLL